MMQAVRGILDEIPAFQVFHEALDAVQEGYPDWQGTHLEIVGAEVKDCGAAFLLAHEPDGPWLAICPLDPLAMAVMEEPASGWAEKQRWDVLLRLSGKREADGQWWLKQLEVTP